MDYVLDSKALMLNFPRVIIALCLCFCSSLMQASMKWCEAGKRYTYVYMGEEERERRGERPGVGITRCSQLWTWRRHVSAHSAISVTSL